MLELVTWNDYGESHYIGPLSSPHYDDGNSKWCNDMYVGLLMVDLHLDAFAEYNC